MEYIGLVLITDEMACRRLSKAPAWSHLEKGDEVIVEDEHGNEQRGKVLAYIDEGVDSDAYSFITEAFGEPTLKTTMKARYSALCWES